MQFAGLLSHLGLLVLCAHVQTAHSRTLDVLSPSMMASRIFVRQPVAYSCASTLGKKPFAISLPPINSSNLSTSLGLSSEDLDNGETSLG